MGQQVFREIILDGGRLPLKELESLAAQGVAVGATHLSAGHLPRKPRHELTDPTDPYLQWSFMHPCLFRYSTPAEVRVMTPPEYEREMRATLRQRAAVLRRHGLRGYLMMIEPHSLPEAVFAEHPAWRGPRCDQARRCRRPYFAPCIDHPEVLDLYRRAMRDLLRDLPDFDLFRFLPNDSGSGVCWSANLYNEANGPEACRGRRFGDRLAGFLQALIQGAADAGVKAKVFASPRGFSLEQLESCERAMPEGASLARGGGGRMGMRFGGADADTAWGVRSVPDVVGALEHLSARVETTDVLSVSLPFPTPCGQSGMDITLAVLRRFLASPARTINERAALLRVVAAEEAGEAVADDLVAVWHLIHDAMSALRFLPFGPTLIMLAAFAQRWLTRPLVAFPLELTADETAYWRPFLFQANTEAEAADLLDIQANRVIVGLTHARGCQHACEASRSHLASAAGLLDRLSSRAAAGAREALAALAWRVRALACVAGTMGNVPVFQALLDRHRGPETREPEMPEFQPGLPERTWLYEVLRQEMDNTNDLIRLMTDSPVPLFETAESAAEEDAFTLGPDLADQLRRKVAITMRRWKEFDRLYPRPNR